MMIAEMRRYRIVFEYCCGIGYPSVSLRGRLLKDNCCFCAGAFTGLECVVASEKYIGYTI